MWERRFLRQLIKTSKYKPSNKEKPEDQVLMVNKEETQKDRVVLNKLEDNKIKTTFLLPEKKPICSLFSCF